MHFAFNYAINRKGIANFGAARIGCTATKKAPECCGFMQFQLKIRTMDAPYIIVPSRRDFSRNRARSNIQSIAVSFPVDWAAHSRNPSGRSTLDKCRTGHRTSP
jgi:hypothetical protein